MKYSKLKPGDRVAIVYSRIGGTQARMHKVEKVNKTTIKVAGTLYDKNTGYDTCNSYTTSQIVSVEEGKRIIAENAQAVRLKRVNEAIDALQLIQTEAQHAELVGKMLALLEPYWKP